MYLLPSRNKSERNYQTINDQTTQGEGGRREREGNVHYSVVSNRTKKSNPDRQVTAYNSRQLYNEHMELSIAMMQIHIY